MNEISEGRVPTAEEKQLVALLLDIEKGQLDLIDTAAKRIIELDTGLLTVLFAITAFGHDFPPPYLQSNNLVKTLVIMALATFLCATFCAMLVMQPRNYSYNRYRPDEMRSTLEKIIRKKSLTLRWAGLLFFCGSLSLGLLIATLILTI